MSLKLIKRVKGVGYVLYSLHVCVCGCVIYDNCGYAPPGYAQCSWQRPDIFFFGRFLLFLADFAIFS
jgi:hypothetical protein